MKNYQIVTMDGRHTGTEYFTHYIQVSWSSSTVDALLRYLDYRKYCWNTWGPSCERDYYMILARGGERPEAPWCFHSADNIRRIYFCSTKEMNWFNLKWM